MSERPRRFGFALALALVTAAGCEEPRQLGGSTKAVAPAKPAEDTFIVGKRTQEVRNANAELQKGAVEGTTKITAKDPITLPGNAYVTIVGRNSILNIQHALDLWRAENDRFPKDYQEFMDEIIIKNNIALPKLPSYQRYGYDEKEHRLIILEYPELRK